MRPYGPDSPWRFAPGLIYLTHGTYGACPVPVLAAQRALMDELEASPIQFHYREYEARLDAAREAVAAFIHADPEGIAVVPNATTGVSTVLRSLRFRPGDELLTTDHEYNAVLNAIQVAADEAKGRVVRAEIRLPIRHPEEVVEAILGAVTPRTRVAVVSHVTSPTGLVFPIETIVRELDRLGVDTIVDAAHAPGNVPVDVAGLGAAYWTANGHKWLCGPKVSGVLHVREDRRSRIQPLVTSHGRNDPRPERPEYWKQFDWQGTWDPTPFMALPLAISVVGGLDRDGWPGLMAANRASALAARDRLQAALGVEPLAPSTMIGSMAAVRLPSVRTDEAAQALMRSLYDEDHIEAALPSWPVPAAREAVSDPPRQVVVRISAQRYNEPSDIEALVSAFERRRLTGASASADGSRASAIVSG